jgi:ABC-type sugar transport system ATPase subunit
LSKKKENNVSRDMVDSLNVVCRSTEQETETLSGGNQQKIVLAKWLQCDPEILVLDEPTIGIDVGSRLEVYRVLRERAVQGTCVLVATSDIQEALGLADRIVVIYAGRTVAEFETNGAERDDVLFHVMGGGQRADEIQ